MTNDVQTAIRLPRSVVAEVDKMAEKLSADGLRITRGAVLRMLIVQGLRKPRATNSRSR